MRKILTFIGVTTGILMTPPEKHYVYLALAITAGVLIEAQEEFRWALAILWVVIGASNGAMIFIWWVRGFEHAMKLVRELRKNDKASKGGGQSSSDSLTNSKRVADMIIRTQEQMRNKRKK